jgi:hypothetical protein
MAMPAVIARRLPQGAYAQRIAKGLSNAYDHRADTDTTELAQLRAVVFSDDHRGRGRGNGADDFRRCEQACCAALGWYLEQGYELWLLGDVEELWENRPKHVMERYREVLEFEQAFGTRLWRFFGNHDMAWRGKKNVQRFLAGHMADARVAESLKLTITDSGQPLGMLYLVHGHQGTLDSGNLLIVPFSRFVVRFVWGRLQRALEFASTSPATGAVLRGKHDRAMAAWADAHPSALSSSPATPIHRCSPRSSRRTSASSPPNASRSTETPRGRTARRACRVRARQGPCPPCLGVRGAQPGSQVLLQYRLLFGSATAT